MILNTRFDQKLTKTSSNLSAGNLSAGHLFKDHLFKGTTPILILFFALHWFALPELALNRKIPAFFAASSMSAMALCFVLAARWRIGEWFTGGLDRGYVWHRRLGIIAVLSILIHWILVPGGAGLSDHPTLAEIGKYSGDLTIGLLILFVVISLLKIIPYHIWKYSHYAMGPIFMLAVFHSFASDIPLRPFSFAWSFVLFISALGIAAWSHKLARDLLRRPSYQVESIKQNNDMLMLTLSPINRAKALSNSRAGQFLFISFDEVNLREMHPFSIAGFKENGQIELRVRIAGDFTRQMAKTLRAGTLARIDGSYGRFLPETGAPRQLWVAGGVGIAPFLGALDQDRILDGRDVHLLVFARSVEDITDLERLQSAKARHPNFHYQIITPPAGEMPSAKPLENLMTQSQDIYFCGPAGLRQMVQKTMKSAKAQNPNLRLALHYEEFDMRRAIGSNPRSNPRPNSRKKRAHNPAFLARSAPKSSTS